MKRAPTQAALYHGKVVHKRFTPVRHRLSYRVFSMLLPLKGIDEVCGVTRFLSHNRFNLVSFHDRDHGLRDGSSVADFVTRTMQAGGVDTDACELLVLCYPRILGYCFNPLTTYYAVTKAGDITAMLYEVSNTFGEHTHYFVTGGTTRNGTLEQGCNKLFHVSPFNEADGEYGFRVTTPDDNVCVGVSLRRAGKAILNAYFKGSRTRLTSRSLVSAVARQPLMTWKVIAGIHLEALRLWMKGLKLRRKPGFAGLTVHRTERFER
ncbi:DUF1365 family protein [Anderseniella sp. Alg231-50]|uniref:DUF1365 family protein n=1 Tax=Anderseniella sp. Alg231-50 TaxID=1922226 RepID=UPI000D558432